MTPRQLARTRPWRALAAFVVLLSALVIVPGNPGAEAANEGLILSKSVDTTAITPGSVSNWDLVIDTSSEITAASAVTVTDIVPDGLCPRGVGEPDCPGGPGPVPAPDTVTENADGTWTLVWSLPDMGPAEQATITYSTLTRTHFQEGYAAATPVLARDSWNNMAQVAGTVDGSQVNDYAAAGQSGAAVPVAVDAAGRPASLVPPAVCGDGAGLSWDADPATGYRVGDQVCWRIAVAFPDLVTQDTVIADSLPPGHRFTANDAWAPGVNNSVPHGDIYGSAIAAGNTALTWSIGDAAGYVAAGAYLEIVFSSTIVDPGATTSGQTVTNTATVSHTNTKGNSYNSSDTARVSVVEPELTLAKGVGDVNDVAAGGADGIAVMENDVVTYQLAVANGGDLAADDGEVWDVLPAKFAPCSSRVTAISHGGSCNDAANRIEWSGLSVAAGASLSITYDVAVPTGIAPGETMSNDAGVRTYRAPINNGSGFFTFIPAGNIESSLSGQNTGPAVDSSFVFTPTPTIGNTRTTGIAAGGNAGEWQATIGELITYTVTVVIPEGTTVYAAALFDDLPSNLDLVSTDHSFDGEQSVVRTEDFGTDSVNIQWPDPYTNASGTGDDTLVLTIVGQVLDVPANSRGTVVGNSAEFTWSNSAAVSRDIPAAVTTTIVEPNIAVEKTSTDGYGNDGTVVGGELVDTTIALSNPAGPNVSTAYDLAVVDTLPEGMTPATIDGGGLWSPDPVPGDGVGGTITWAVASLPPGSIINLTYQLSVDDPVVVNAVFTNSVTVSATSMPGAVGGERTAGSDYSAADTDTLIAPIVAIAKTALPTAVTIGGLVDYSLELTIPPGTIMYDATILDVMPAGMVFDEIISTTCVMGGGACVPAIDVQHHYMSGETNSFFLGDLDTSGSAARVFTIVYQAHPGAGETAGDTLTNTAGVSGNTTDNLADDPGFVAGPFDVAAGPVTASVTVVEPSLSIDKDVSLQAGDSDYRRAVPGEQLDFSLVVTNAGGTHGAPAYDITVVDTLPAGLAVPASITGGGVWDGGTRSITWTIPGPLAAGGAMTLDYTAAVDSALNWADEDVGGAELVNSADINSYYGVPEAMRALHGHAYRIYTEVAADDVAVELDLARVGDFVWFDVDGDGLQDPTEPPLEGIDVTVTYHGADGLLGTGDDEARVMSTAGDGSYAADYLPGGQYTVTVDADGLPEGMVPSFNLDATLDHVWAGAVAENAAEDRIDFGYTGTGSIGASVWFDADGDGTYDAEEFGLEGVAVTVTWWGPDGAPSSDDVAYPTTTDGAGSYLVNRLPAGLYAVAVDVASLPAGMYPTYDANGTGTADWSVVALGVGADDRSQDFGYAGSGTIGDAVWLDRNGDGMQQAAEPGVAGVPVQLTWPGEDGIRETPDDAVFLKFTDETGLYVFANLPPGEYRVDVLGALPTVAVNSYDEDGGGDSSAVVVLPNGGDHRSADFGFQGSATIGDTVWWDRDGDGVLDAGESGLSNVEVALTYSGLDGTLGTADDLEFTAVTDPSGNYGFSDLPAGDYEIVIAAALAGTTLTFDEDGGGDGRILVAGLGVGEVHLTADFGFAGTGSIGDLVWLDRVGDGVRAADEPGIPDVVLELTWHGGDSLPVTADDLMLTTTTDIDGNYLFDALPAGGYEVTVVSSSLPGGLTPTFDADGLGSLHRTSVTLAGAADDASQDFGYTGGASIGDTVWFDRDGDGSFGAGEYGIGGVGVDLMWAGPDGSAGTADDEAFGITTAADGSYAVSSLPAGRYTVAVDPVTLPAGMVAVSDADGTLDHRTTVEVGDGAVHHSADFGYAGTGAIGGMLWLDLDGDGLRAADEPGIPQQAVGLLWWGPDAVSGTADDQVYATVSDEAGSYRFGGLAAGTFEVTVQGPIVSAAGNVADEDGDRDSHTAVSLAVDESHLSSDFGYRGSVEIGDLVWLDLNGDGLFGSLETGLGDVALGVVWLGADAAPGGGDDVVLPELRTDAAGGYLATGLPAGNYTVEVVDGIPAGLVNGTDEDGTNDGRVLLTGLAAGSSHPTADFGYVGSSSLGGTVWWDLDGDGLRASPEAGFGAVAVSLVWAGFDDTYATPDDASLDAATDPTGSYRFELLPPGDYRVVVAAEDLPADVAISADPDPTWDGQTTVTVEELTARRDLDFGYRGAGSAGDFVWYDFDGDGIQGDGEPGVADVAITVTYLGGDGAAGGGDDIGIAVTTDSAGRYLVPGLPSGFYSAALDADTLPFGTEATVDLDSGDPTRTSFVVGAAGNELDVDYGVVGRAAAAGTVWNDRNGDGVNDDDEVGIAGVEVVIAWDGPAGRVAKAVVTDAYGRWESIDLPPGEYTVELDATTAPLGMAATTAPARAATPAIGAPATVDFGLALLLAVGSNVWIDGDGNGTVDSGEPGIANVLLNLYDESGDLAGIAETDDAGRYHIAELRPGIYVLRLDEDSLPGGLLATWDRDGGADGSAVIDLTGGVDILDANFGFRQGLPLTGFDVGPLAIWGALMVLFGMALVVTVSVSTRAAATPTSKQ
jgi:uncharacterized repeat protein (TIGR01451 family)/fimbrial isopeptide formation D2 family protein